MCGISAILTTHADGLETAIASMVSVMNHRGPDGHGTYIDRVGDGSYLALGHNRLSIIDLTEHAAQPMTSRDGRFVLIYNGEVYNYREIARQLDRRDLPDESCGDTAVVLAALARWGPSALAKFNGMWALLLYDTQAKTLLVSRDRFGVKPLYYYRNGAEVVFASEIKGISAANRSSFAVNSDVAIPYLTRGLLNVSLDTFFTGVQQFPPASYQVLDLQDRSGSAAAPQRYWQHPFEAGEEPVAGTVSPGQLQEVFIDAVTLRLRSDVPVGVLLSGGVDSSSIVGAVAKAGALGNLTVLSVISDDPFANEERFIDLMAAFVNVVPQKVNVSTEPAGLLDRLSEAIWFNDEPLSGIADIAHLRLMERARSLGIKVLLTGQGADEQLGGYNKFLYFWLQEQLRHGHYLDAATTLAKFALHSDTLYEFRISEAIRYLGSPRLAQATFIPREHRQRDWLDIGSLGSYPKREWIDLVKTSVPSLLHQEDRMSMSQSVEMRVPFLDFRLVELLARVHPSEKLAGGRTKSIFRQAMTGVVPPGIQYRRDKRGFSVPEDSWMKDAFRPAVSEVFHSTMMAADLGLIDAGRLRGLYAAFVRGRGYLNGRHFFRVYAFEMFLRRFLRNGRA